MSVMCVSRQTAKKAFRTLATGTLFSLSAVAFGGRGRRAERTSCQVLLILNKRGKKMINHASQSSLLIAALLGISVIAVAQTPDPEGYLLDTRGAVVKSGFGLCWKTTRWTPAMAIAECDADLVKKEAVTLAAKTEAPPKPAAVKVTLAADALFDFDKAVLRPEGKAKLDDVSR